MRRLPCNYGVGFADVGESTAREAARTSSEQDESQPKAVKSVIVPPANGPSRDRNESLMTADWLEKIVMGDRVPTALPATFGGELNGPYKVHDIARPDQRVIPGDLSTSWGGRAASQGNPTTVQLIPFLPAKADTMALFQYYTAYIDYLYHIILPNRVEAYIHAIYEAIEKQEPLNLNHLALLFSILASSLFLQLSIQSSVHAETCSREHTFLTGAALIQSNYFAYPTIEGLQATMIVAHHVSNMNSHPSVSALFVHGTIVSQAKNLMLHCIDSPRWQEERKTNEVDMMDIELKRRLWWDLASYDW